ncbi:MAG TPA: hypothetical protein DEP53_03550 [Bacteroidetes bacterium]|nr:hypothetical protein [Bacteroidota bacterium]
MTPHDWSKFSTRININAAPQDVYTAWTSRAALERWFLRVAEFTDSKNNIRAAESAIRQGDTYRWLWHGYDDSVVERGTIVELNDNDYLRFTFAGSCLVTVAAQRRERETILELRQENIPTDEESRIRYHVGCLTGWTFYLANLKSILEGGIDLRNKNANLQHVLNA